MAIAYLEEVTDPSVSTNPQLVVRTAEEDFRCSELGCKTIVRKGQDYFQSIRGGKYCSGDCYETMVGW